MSKDLKNKTIKECKPKYILETFFNGEKIVWRLCALLEMKIFFIDSGAFSYMNGAKVTLEQMEKYVQRYIDFIKQYKIKCYFQIDVDNVFGLEQVEKWTAKMEKEIGYKCIPVWHKGRGVEYWKKMCNEYKYIAIGELVFHVKKQEYKLIKKLVDYAYNRDVKVHGLGFTKTNILPQYKFYSVDSSSWNIGVARGQQIHIFKNGKIKSRRLDKGNKKVNLSMLISYNMKEWVKFQKYAERGL